MKKQVEVIKFLGEKWKTTECPMCKDTSWSISENIFELREYSDGNLIIGNVPIVPIVPVTCNNCGNTIMINAIVANITSNGKKDEK
ncbi:hypothetical protein HOK00_07455 [bacterium]|jgi:hypothetical protein|nr:hypothetical protein [bacterium]